MQLKTGSKKRIRTIFESVLSRTNATNSIKCIYWPMQKRIGMLYCIGKWNAMGVLLPIFFIPARGRKQPHVRIVPKSSKDFLYPREGTETHLSPSVSRLSARDSLYPREGTETNIGIDFEIEYIGIFFIPARGRKRKAIYLGKAVHLDFLYPREGTETLLEFLSQMPLRIFFIPARGRKLHPSYGVQLIFRFSLSPRGDGNRHLS